MKDTDAIQRLTRMGQRLVAVALLLFGLAGCSGSPAPTPSDAVVLTSTPNPSTFGQSITLTAAVSSNAGTPTGTITFEDSGLIIETVTLVAGTATFSWSGFFAGGHSFTAVYSASADRSLPGNSSPTVFQAISQAATSTDLLVTQPGGAGTPLSLVATVSASGTGGFPSGLVTFFVDGAVSSFGDSNPAGAFPTSDHSSSATLLASSVSAGTHDFSATFAIIPTAGSISDYLGSSSETQSVTVQ